MADGSLVLRFCQFGSFVKVKEVSLLVSVRSGEFDKAVGSFVPNFTLSFSLLNPIQPAVATFVAPGL